MSKEVSGVLICSGDEMRTAPFCGAAGGKKLLDLCKMLP